MKFKLIFGLLLCACSAGTAQAATANAATAPGHGPKSSWNEMQKFEYYLGDLAGALNLCRRDGLYRELRELAVLTPYGQAGLDAWLSIDAVRGCPGLSNAAKDILKDKEEILDYLKARYDCSSGKCVER